MDSDIAYRIAVDEPSKEPILPIHPTAPPWRAVLLALALLAAGIVAFSAFRNIYESYSAKRDYDRGRADAMLEKKAEEERRAAEEVRSVSQEASALAGEFVDIPRGTFQMGCSPGDSECRKNEHPMHTVSIKPFRMGKYEVTVGQFRRFVEAAGYRTDAERGGNCMVEEQGNSQNQGRDWHNPGFRQTERDPVVCVSWNDAEAYIQWLSRQGVGRYSLPSESEWEYAARAGSRGRYSFGDSADMLCQYGNIADRTGGRQFGRDSATFCDDGVLNTAPVGGYRPNRFGLHDMHGNVVEWTEDCYHYSYAGAPSDGTAWTAGDCAQRVFRGSAWVHQPRWVSSSFRAGDAPDHRESALGFRLLQRPTEALPTLTTLPSVGGQPPPDTRKDNLQEGDITQVLSLAEEKLLQVKRRAEESSPPKGGNRKTARAANVRGLAYLQSRRISEAIGAFQEAHRAEPADVEIVNNLGYAYLLNNDLDSAERYVLTALAMQPGRSAGWDNLGQIYAKKGQIPAAVASFVNTYRFSRDLNKTHSYFLGLLEKENDVNLRQALRQATQVGQRKFLSAGAN